MAVPNIFATATTSIPLSQLDANFAYFANAITVNYSSTAMTIDASGNIGIGNTTPASNSGYITTTVNGTSGGILQLQVNTTNTFQIYCTASALYLNGQTNIPMLFYTNGSERMRLNAAGSLLLGTTTDNGLLSVDRGSTASAMAHFKNNATNGAWTAYDYNGTVYGYIGSGSNLVTGAATSDFVLRATANMIFGVGTTERARITSGGELCIGTTGPQGSARLHVKGVGSTNATYITYIENSSQDRVFAIEGDGRWYTGTAATSPYNNTTGNAANMFVDSNGILYRSTSSLKYKTDVQDATHGLNEVMQLRPVTYKGKKDGDTVFGGLIAEEVHDAGLTEFVQYADDGTPDALAYGNMVSLCIKAIQELKAELDAVKAELATLKGA